MTGKRFVFRQEKYRACKSGRCNPGPPHTCILVGRRRESHACDTSHCENRTRKEERWSTAYDLRAEYSDDTGLSVKKFDFFQNRLIGVFGGCDRFVRTLCSGHHFPFYNEGAWEDVESRPLTPMATLSQALAN